MARKAAPAKRARKAPPPARKGSVLDALERLSVSELRRVVDRANALIQERAEGERRTFIEEVTARAKSLGLSVTELFGRSAPKPRKPSAPRKKAGAKRASPTVQYRGPNGEEWSGRGRPARWITELEAQGRKREEFAV